VKVPEVTKKVEKAKENPKANVPVTKPTPAKPVEQQVIKGATIPVRTGGNGTLVQTLEQVVVLMEMEKV
jgi:hypothetical protein